MTAASPPTVHLTGPVRVDAEHVEPQAWVVGGRLTFTRPAGSAAARVTIDGWVLPGLVDAHCHVGLGPAGEVDRATTRAQAEADRDTGVLLIRDAGSPADTRWIDAAEDLPRLVRAGRHVARTRRYLRHVGEEIEPDRLVAEVRRQARRGDGWVKLVGDWIDRERGDLAPCWPDDALAEAVAAAHAEGARVTAHCFATESLPGLLDAGIDGVEHGTGFTEDLAARAAAAGVAVVPTLVQVDTFPALAAQGEARFPVWAARMRRLHARRRETVEMLHARGVPIFAGTDAGSVLSHGRIAEEIAALADVLGAEAAVGSATWRARRWLGRPGLAEGAPADLVVLPADPLADVAALTAPVAVVLRGRVVAGGRPG
ncbi:MAG: amidohydrolase family protein [Kineosporiaceae bacterium]